MLNWIANGVSLGWLIDADDRKVWIYTPKGTRELQAPTVLSGEGLVAGFELTMEPIYRGLRRHRRT